jgi:hypothetical protein
MTCNCGKFFRSSSCREQKEGHSCLLRRFHDYNDSNRHFRKHCYCACQDANTVLSTSAEQALLECFRATVTQARLGEDFGWFWFRSKRSLTIRSGTRAASAYGHSGLWNLQSLTVLTRNITANSLTFLVDCGSLILCKGSVNGLSTWNDHFERILCQTVKGQN